MNYGRISAIVLALLCAGCMADIRTPALLEHGLEKRWAAQGRRLLDRAAERAGQQRYDRAHSLRVVMRDHWTGLAGSLVGPWPASDQRLRFESQPHSFNARATFLDGPKKDSLWGIQSWKTYTVGAKDSQASFAPDDTMTFILPTVQYFIEMPFRIRQAQLITYAGKRSIDGVVYDTVLATWGEDLEPRADMDQYLVYIHPNTGLIDRVRYTVRDMQRAITTIDYRDYRDVDGLQIPFSQIVTSAPDDDPEQGYLHAMTLEHVELDTIPTATFYPRSDLPKTGLRKP